MTVRSPRETPGDASWFTHDRFGMFIHWGLYALGARHEWQQIEEPEQATEYPGRYFPRFDPDLYDPEAWADAAAGAGMRYVVVVAKHQEGFCLWDSALTDFKAPNAPAGRDLLRPLLDAFRDRGLRTGLFYSLIDWQHPDYTVDWLHPLGKGRTPEEWEKLNEGRDMERYRQYVKGQVRELLTDYGPIDLLFADFAYDPPGFERMATSPGFARAEMPGKGAAEMPGKGADDWDSAGLLAMVRELQPGILVNDRLGLEDGWDIKTPEQTIPAQWPLVHGEPALWETCQTFAGRWGYTRYDPEWKNLQQLAVMLVDVVGKGGNMLLNVGPTARGDFEPRVLERLAGLGAWMHRHGRAIYGCTEAPEDIRRVLPSDTRATYNPTTNRLYLHLLHWPAQPLVVPGLLDRVEYAQLLTDGSELLPPRDMLSQLHAPAAGALWLELPAAPPDPVLPVIEIFLRDV